MKQFYPLNINWIFCKKQRNDKLLGCVLPVLVEGKNEKGKLFGYTDTNKLINFDGDISLVGQIVDVRVVDAKTWSLDGELDE